MKDYNGREKGLLRYAARGLLPENVLWRKKSPYPKTFDPKYTQLVTDQLTDLLYSDSPLWHLLQKNMVKNFLQEESVWPWYGQLMRRPQTIAYLLQLDFWLKYYDIEMCF